MDGDETIFGNDGFRGDVVDGADVMVGEVGLWEGDEGEFKEDGDGW